MNLLPSGSDDWEYSRGLLASDHRQTLEFFSRGLLDVSERTVDRRELLYTASVLAHYAQVSTQSSGDWPAPADLSAVFDNFVLDRSMVHDARMMETAGAQCLLLAGFFERQMKDRHSIRYYARLGAGFLREAAAEKQLATEAAFLYAYSDVFEIWRRRCAWLSKELREQRFALKRRAGPGAPAPG